MTEKEKTVRVHFVGEVQGVGFRFSCHSLAERSGIRGWIRNNPDGSVTLVAQGKTETIDQYILSINALFKNNIRSCETFDEAASLYENFTIKFF